MLASNFFSKIGMSDKKKQDVITSLIETLNKLK